MVVQNPASLGGAAFPGDSDGMDVKQAAQTYAAPTFATVGVATGVVLAANASRRMAIIVNDAADDVYLGIGAAAVVGSGIRLNANGGSVQIGGWGGLILSTQVINGISNTAGQNVTVHEVT